MQTQKPAVSIVEIQNADDAKAYKIICECTSDEHTVDTWIEIERDDEIDMIEMTFYVKTWTPIFRSWWPRVKTAWNVLVKGVNIQEHSILLKRQGAENWLAAMQNAVNELDEKMSKK